MSKKLAFEENARESIRRGVATLARVVKCTLGPRGRNVLLQKGFGPPLVTKDGVTVAKEVDLEDPFENMGAQMVREVAAKTNDVAGDGTTTATILAEAIFNEGLRAVVAGINPILLKRGIELAVRDIVAHLQASSVGVQSQQDVIRVATIAANNDPTIGSHVADALGRVGQEGIVTLDQGKLTATEIEFVEGMQFDQGYLSPYFITDSSKMVCTLEEPKILICESKITRIKDIVPLLEKIAQSGSSLLVIAEEVDGEALATLIVNRLRNTLACCAVKAPGYGERRKGWLEDIATISGGRAILASLGVTLDSLGFNDLGSAQKVIVDKEHTTIIQGAGSPAEIDSRVSQFRQAREQASSSYDREQYEERIAKLASGVARIRVGATTESELKEKMFLYEDAINAAKAAAKEGIVPGGGVALLRASQACQTQSLPHDEQLGYNLVRRACHWPLTCIAQNAGKTGELVCEKVAEMSGSVGYNAMTDTYEDLMLSGVVDPTKVVRCELEYAASVATLLLTCDALVAEQASEPQAGQAEF